MSSIQEKQRAEEYDPPHFVQTNLTPTLFYDRKAKFFKPILFQIGMKKPWAV